MIQILLQLPVLIRRIQLQTSLQLLTVRHFDHIN
jgi:hypothetical protein